MLDSQASILDAGAMYETYVEYCKACGMISVEHGKQLEKLYDAQDKYLYMHSIDYRGQNVEKLGLTLDGISESICREGLRLTTMGNEVGKLSYTTLNTKDDRWFSLINFIPYWSKRSGLVVLQIPKSKVDNGEPIIGSNVSAELSPSNPGYVLPEYVVGRIVDGAYQENPILEAARSRYKYVVPEVGKTSNNKGYSM
jgi:hypothetical protein